MDAVGYSLATVAALHAPGKSAWFRIATGRARTAYRDLVLNTARTAQETPGGVLLALAGQGHVSAAYPINDYTITVDGTDLLADPVLRPGALFTIAHGNVTVTGELVVTVDGAVGGWGAFVVVVMRVVV